MARQSPGAMADHLDARLRRKLVKRRGQLHAFDRLVPQQTAVVVIDMTTPFVEGVPGGEALAAPINGLTAAMRAAGGMVAWVTPTPPSTWRSRVATTALLGADAVSGYDRDMADGGPGTRIHSSLTVAAGDWLEPKTGHSAFFPGNSPLPDRLRAHGVDTVLLAGVLTDVCVAASARDAHESGFKVLVCADGVAANEPALHLASLRTLARVYADVRPAAELAALLGRP